MAASKSPSPLRIRTRARKIGTPNSLLNRLTASFPSMLGKIHCRCIAGILRLYRAASITLFPISDNPLPMELEAARQRQKERLIELPA